MDNLAGKRMDHHVLEFERLTIEALKGLDEMASHFMGYTIKHTIEKLEAIREGREIDDEAKGG